jgi:hypothetical protein
MCGGAHWSLQLEFPQTCPPWHDFLQSPQWSGSLVRSTQTPLHRDKPALQAVTHCPPAHWERPLSTLPQALPQLPQLPSSLVASTQALPQRVSLPVQTKSHLPPRHTAPAADVEGQACPQAPQFLGSLSRSTHLPPHATAPPVPHVGLPSPESIGVEVAVEPASFFGEPFAGFGTHSFVE